MHPSKAIVPALLLACCSGASATVFPGVHAGYEPVPLGSEQDACVHEVFSSFLFSAASGGNSVRITAIALAPQNNGAFNAVIGIRLGYTNAVPGVSGPTGLQPPTSVAGGGAPNSIGAMTTFVPSHSYGFTFSNASPNNFQIAATGQQPFIYDPSQGNLLVEIVTSVHGGFPAYNEPVSFATGGSAASMAFNSTRFGAQVVREEAPRIDFTFTPVATGACCFSDGSCRFIASQNCSAQGGTYAGNTVSCAQANCPQPGACCMGDGSCAFEFAVACAAAGGVFRGAGVTCAQADCPQPGACCMPDGTCAFEFAEACGAASGVFRGAGVTCAQANCPPPGACCLPDGTCAQEPASLCVPAGGIYLGDHMPCSGCAQPGACCLGGSCSVLLPSQCTAQNGLWQGAASCSSVSCPSCYAVNGGFESGALLPGWSADSQYWGVSGAPLPGYSESPHGGAYAAYFYVPEVESTFYSTMGQIIPARAGSRVTISAWYWMSVWTSGVCILGGGAVRTLPPSAGWTFFQTDFPVLIDNPALEFRVFATRQFPNMVPALAYFDEVSVCAACYANCDGSSQSPVLNVNDFACFLNQFAAGTAYANCDGSTTPPVLNVNDFACFINRFATGCP